MSNDLSSARKAPRVLVVDDDPIFTAMADASLRQHGFDVRTASDGVEGLELLDAKVFDLLIVDLQMPRIDGLRLIALVRGASRLRDLAIIVASGHEEAGAFREALSLGADAVLKKPVDWRDLPDLVHDVIATRRSRRDEEGA